MYILYTNYEGFCLRLQRTCRCIYRADVMYVVSRGAQLIFLYFFFNDPATTEIYPLPLHDALPISGGSIPPTARSSRIQARRSATTSSTATRASGRSSSSSGAGPSRFRTSSKRSTRGSPEPSTAPPRCRSSRTFGSSRGRGACASSPGRATPPAGGSCSPRAWRGAGAWPSGGLRGAGAGRLDQRLEQATCRLVVGRHLLGMPLHAEDEARRVLQLSPLDEPVLAVRDRPEPSPERLDRLGVEAVHPELVDAEHPGEAARRIRLSAAR